MHQILKRSYYHNYRIDHNQNLHSDRDHKVPSMGGPNVPQTNPRWRMATILKKNEKSQYLHNGLTDFNKSWHTGAPRSSGPLQPIKFHDFENPRWRRPSSFKKSENRNNFATDWPILNKFCTMVHLRPHNPFSQ